MNHFIQMLARLIGIANTCESFNLSCEEFQYSCIANQMCKDSYFKSLGLDFYIDIFDEEVPTYKFSLGFTAIGLCMMQHVKYMSPTSSTNLAKFLLDGKTYAEPSKEAFIERLTLLGRLILKSEPVTVKDFKLSNSHMDYKRAKEMSTIVNYFIKDYSYDHSLKQEFCNGKPT